MRKYAEVQKYVDAYSDEMKATLLLPAGVTSLANIQTIGMKMKS